MTTYSIAQLVEDLKRLSVQVKDEREIISRLRPLARRAALSKETWLEARMYHADAAQVPDRGAPPHDHGTWAVIAGVDGPEKNEFFERADDGSRPGHAKLRKVGEKVCGVGDVVAMPRGMIHGVWNETDAVSVSLHIYGKHVNHTGRSQFDLEKQTETPFVVKMAG